MAPKTLKRYSSAAFGLVALLLLGFGCNPVARVQENVIENAIERESGGEADVDVRANGTVRVETEDGSFQAGAGAGLPANWPNDVPVMPGAQIQISGSNNEEGEGSGSGIVFLTMKTMEEVATYYREELVKNGWTVEGTAVVGGYTAITAVKGEVGLSVAITSANGQTMVTIGIDR